MRETDFPMLFLFHLFLVAALLKGKGISFSVKTKRSFGKSEVRSKGGNTNKNKRALDCIGLGVDGS